MGFSGGGRKKREEVNREQRRKKAQRAGWWGRRELGKDVLITQDPREDKIKEKKKPGAKREEKTKKKNLLFPKETIPHVFSKKKKNQSLRKPEGAIRLK